ncbi:RDD family protein [Salsipaludibacter albus]|uniref:RDD family protein n=1 Tax=Salsipaludibacter albus TaxID=2849650 RepID=UPI001EE3EA9A|nr:RDD family protein [Salsipaludibacter albus]MBY5161315.1 RDD family protein [Salsipaludibacter albus]
MVTRADDRPAPRNEARGLGRVGHLVGAVSNRVLGELDPDIVVAQLDVDSVLARVDLDAVLARVDLDAVLARVDVDALLERIDVDAVLARVDADAVLDRVDMDRLLDRVAIDRLLDRVDANGLLDRVDVDRLLERADVDGLVQRVDVQRLAARLDLDPVLASVDLDAVLARVDVDVVLARIDLERVLARVDLDLLVARIDLDAIVDRLDVAELVQRAGIPDLVADSTGQLAGSALDLARRQLVAVDVGTWRIAQRLGRRDPASLPAGPATLVEDEAAAVELPDPDRSRVRARAEVSGFYAGPISRLLAFGADLALATTLFTVGTAAMAWLADTVVGIDLIPGDGSTSTWWVLASLAWLFLYWSTTTIVAGRTPAMLLAGLRVTARDGTPLPPSRALVRTLAIPLSVPGFLGGAWMMVDHERRALHDLVAGSTVVYDWGGRPAEMPTPLAHWIDQRDQPPGPDVATPPETSSRAAT